MLALKDDSHMLALKDDSKVCSLIEQTTKDWNGQMIDQKIAPFMAQRIKGHTIM